MFQKTAMNQTTPFARSCLFWGAAVTAVPQVSSGAAGNFTKCKHFVCPSRKPTTDL
jgi:hypothetical protein